MIILNTTLSPLVDGSFGHQQQFVQILAICLITTLTSLFCLKEKNMYSKKIRREYGEYMKEVIKEAFSILFAIISIYIFLVFILSL